MGRFLELGPSLEAIAEELVRPDRTLKTMNSHWAFGGFFTFCRTLQAAVANMGSRFSPRG